VKVATPEVTVTGPLPPVFVQVSEPPAGLFWRDSVTAVLLSDVTVASPASWTETAIETDAPAPELVGSLVNASLIAAGGGEDSGRGGEDGAEPGDSGATGGACGGEPGGRGVGPDTTGGRDGADGVGFEAGGVEA